MITEVSPTQFVVKVNGQVVRGPLPSRHLAEAALFSLPQDQQSLAEIVPTTTDGKQVLFG